MKRVIIPIEEKELKNDYEVGQELWYYDEITKTTFYGKIVNIYHDPKFMNLNLIIEVINETTETKKIQQ